MIFRPGFKLFGSWAFRLTLLFYLLGATISASEQDFTGETQLEEISFLTKLLTKRQEHHTTGAIIQPLLDRLDITFSPTAKTVNIRPQIHERVLDVLDEVTMNMNIAERIILKYNIKAASIDLLRLEFPRSSEDYWNQDAQTITAPLLRMKQVFAELLSKHARYSGLAVDLGDLNMELLD
ncbi:MAG: hypothetical protein Q9169_007446 [Polycauliona sp. 2 TL-2023]